MRFESLGSALFAVSLGMIVLMYLLKRKYVDTVVPSHVLWNRVLQNMEANRPWQKLRNRLLLWLQLAVALLLVLALMQPFVSAGKEDGSHIVLVADVSASMSAEDAAGQDGSVETRLARMKSQLRDFVEGPAKGASVTLIRMAGQPELLESRQTSTSKLLQSIDGLDVNYGKTAYRETMSLAASLARSEKDAEIIVYTDGQWPETPEGLSFPGPVRTERITGNGGNVGIAQFGVKGAEGGSAQGIAVIRNGTSMAQQVEATLRYGDQAREVRRLALEPGEKQTIRFDRMNAAPVYELKIEANDAYPADNAAYAFLSQQGDKRVLLITQGNLFLEKALQLSGAEVTKILVNASGVSSGAEPLAVPEGQIDLIVLDRVEPQLISTDQWKEMLAHKPVWEIGIGGPEGKSTALPASGGFRIADHPVNQYLRFEDVHIAEASDKTTPTWGEPIVQAGDVPLVYAGTEQGQRRLRFAFDLHRSDLPLRPEFPILVRNAADWLAEAKTVSAGRMLAGSSQELPLLPSAVSAEWVHVDHADKKSAPISALQTAPSVPGLYQFVQKDGKGEQIGSMFADVVSDASESNLSLHPELTFSVQGTPSETKQDGTAVQLAEQATKLSFVPWIAMLIMILLLLEWRVYQRGDSI